MADILPVETMLPVINEGDAFSFTFTELLEADEILTSLEISKTDFPPDINVSGATFSGNFYGLFELPKDSLKYRDGNNYVAVSSFAALPPKGTVDLYSYTAPREMIKDFTIDVTLKYMKGAVGAELPMELTKTYTQQVLGNYSIFTQMFLNYVR